MLNQQMSSAVRFAFVGCGAIARHHLRALQTSRHDARVTVVVDTERKHAQEFGKLLPNDHKVLTCLSDALECGGFDAVVLMVPHHLHEEYATRCLQRDKHVLLEKPLAHTLESCQTLLRAVDRSRSVFMVAENSAFWPEVLKAKHLIDSDVIGQPYYAKANYWESVGSATFLEEGELVTAGTWRYDPVKSGGGVLMDGATHWIRPLRLWFGDIEEVIGNIGYPFKSSRVVESLAEAMLRFKSGKTASLFCHFVDIPMHPLPFFQIFGDKGEITINGSFDGGMSLRTTDSPQAVDLGSQGGFSAAFAPQMNTFLDAIVEGKSLAYSGRQALGEVLVAMAIYKSVVSKKWEHI